MNSGSAPKINSYTQVSTARFNQYSVQTEPQPAKPKKSRRWLKRIGIALLLIVIFGGSAFLIFVYKSTHTIFVGKNNGFAAQVQSLFASLTNQTLLVGEKEDSINILLLGIGGEGHDGPYLTDSIIVAQIKPSTQSVALSAIPRDFLVESHSLGATKINAIFAEGMGGNNKDWDASGKRIREAVEKLSGLTIPYFAVLDFSGFEKAIDEVGGLDITIDTTFTDYTYPDSGTGYLPPVTFKAGTEHMNGRRALIFSRSRHAPGSEGTDFARSVRQQKVISAFKEKVVNLNLITDLNSLQKLLNIFASHFHTNLSPGEILKLYSIGKDVPRANIVTASLSPESRLICDLVLAESGAYVLVPCPGKSDADIKFLFTNALTIGKLNSEKSLVLLADLTSNKNSLQAAEKILNAYGITTVRTSVPPNTFTTTTLIPLKDNKQFTSRFISESLNASPRDSLPPGVTISEAANASSPNFLLVLAGNPHFIDLPKPSGNSYDKYRSQKAASSTPTSSATSSAQTSKPTATSSKPTTKTTTTPTSTKTPSSTKKATSSTSSILRLP